jgi:hypothetical protein
MLLPEKSALLSLKANVKLKSMLFYLSNLNVESIEIQISMIIPYLRTRGVINGKAGKATALPKFSLTLSQSRGQIIPNHWLCLTYNFT